MGGPEIPRASAIRELATARSSPRAAAAFVEHTVQIWDLRSVERLSEFDTVFDFGGRRIALSPSGDLCVAAGWTKGKRGGVAGYDAIAGSVVWHRADIRQTQFIRFSCLGDIVWCGVEAGRFQQLDSRTGATLDSFAGIKSIIDSPHSNHLLLQTRRRGFWIKGSKKVHVPNLSFALLDAAFSADAVCLSEAAGPVRCLDCHSGVEQWRYHPSGDTHVLRVHYRPADGHFYGVQWDYQRGKSRTLFRFGGERGQYEEIRRLHSWDEEFCMGGDALITSAGEVISLVTGDIIHQLDFPQMDYPGGVTV